MKKIETDVTLKWYQHESEAVVENEKCKILWDVSIQTDYIIEARRPDMIVVDKVKKYCEIIDFAIPYDSKRTRENRKVPRSAERVKENVEYESKHHTNCNRSDGSNSKEAAEKIRAVGNKDAAGRTTEKCYIIHCENTTKGS